MSSYRCAVCKYFRRRCPQDCVFAPYFPNNNPQRFTCVNRIYGASNIGKMLQEKPEYLRADAVECLYYEAQCRIQDPVYGCVGIISSLVQQIQKAQSQLAKTQAKIAFLDAKFGIDETEPSMISEPLVQENVVVDHGLDDPSNYYWFNSKSL